VCLSNMVDRVKVHPAAQGDHFSFRLFFFAKFSCCV
jgi:hypothetical protein